MFYQCSVDVPDILFGHLRIRDKIDEPYFLVKKFERHWKDILKTLGGGEWNEYRHKDMMITDRTRKIEK